MLRAVLCCALLALVAVPCRADEPAGASETLIRLTVSPAPAPKPALRYVLLPELKEMNPGNPIQGYLKCFREQQRFFFDKETLQRREQLLAMPLKDLPAEELRDYGGFALRQADWAARLDRPDWQVLLNLKAEGVYLLLPDVQGLRPLAKALKVRMRAEIALGQFDNALRTAQTILAISRHLGQHPTLVGNLIGAAIANTALGPLEEMLQQPGCPNLYWALTNLPNPLVPLDKGMQGERMSLHAEFRDLDDRAPMSAEQLTRFLTDKDRLLALGETQPGSPTVRAWLDARARDDAALPAARRRLVDYGLPEERVRRFPSDQVILLDEKRALEVRWDDAMRTITLPFWLAERLGNRSGVKRPQSLFADALVPAVDQAIRVRGRLEQRIALLRHVEALRLYAAEHHGTLPAALSDVSVPLPDDPFTSMTFQYEAVGNIAHLRGTPPPGKEKDPSYHLHYEVIVRK